MKGVEHYTSGSGFRVIRIHYTADHDKDPTTPQGADWFRRETSSLVGGIKSSSWRSEMEIDWHATGGELVFPQFEAYKSNIVVAPFSIPETWSLYGSFDYGHRNPSAFYIHAIDYDGNVWTVWEYYRAGDGYRDTARAIRACPYYGRLSYLPIADPSLWGEDQQTENEVKSVAQLFFELPDHEQVIFAKGKAGGDVTFAEKINGEFWRAPEEPPKGWKFEPRWRIFGNCPSLISELARIRYAEWGSQQQEVKNLREQIVDRDNHAFDSCKYFFTRFFSSPLEKQQEPYLNLKASDPRSYEEWMAVSRLYQSNATGMYGEE